MYSSDVALDAQVPLLDLWRLQVRVGSHIRQAPDPRAGIRRIDCVRVEVNGIWKGGAATIWAPIGFDTVGPNNSGFCEVALRPVFPAAALFAAVKNSSFT